MEQGKIIFYQNETAYRFFLNEQVYFDISFDSDGKPKIQNAIGIDLTRIKLVDITTKAFIKLDDDEIPYITIDKKTKKASTRLKYIHTTYLRNNGDLSNRDISEEEKIVLQRNKEAITRAMTLETAESKTKNELELHTHFMEVLSGEEFFDLIKDEIPGVFITENFEASDKVEYDPENPSEFKTTYINPVSKEKEEYPYWISIDKLLNNPTLYNKYINSLSITSSHSVEFSDLTKVAGRRQSLMEIYTHTKIKPAIEREVKRVKYDDEIDKLAEKQKQEKIAKLKARLAEIKKTPSNEKEYEEINQILQELREIAPENLQKRQKERMHQLNDKISKMRAKAEDRKEIYFKMLIASLKKLEREGIKYVEFSFSNEEIIEYLHTELRKRQNELEEIKNIKFGFLYSAHRTKELKYYKSNATDSAQKQESKAVEDVLSRLIEKGLICGFDLMGQESQIALCDFFPTIEIPYYKSETPTVHPKHGCTLYDRLYLVMKTLVKYPEKKLQLRLHAGEIPAENNAEYENIITERNTNPEKTLTIIELIIKQLNIERKEEKQEELIIPPPFIRIGHGLHFAKTQKYIDLLKKYHVIVEINATSNHTLSNIKDLYKIPYNWYLENGIPIVISTDGGGFYLTTPIDEMDLARIFGNPSLTTHPGLIKTTTELEIHEEEALKHKGV